MPNVPFVPWPFSSPSPVGDDCNTNCCCFLPLPLAVVWGGDLYDPLDDDNEDDEGAGEDKETGGGGGDWMRMEDLIWTKEPEKRETSLSIQRKRREERSILLTTLILSVPLGFEANTITVKLSLSYTSIDRQLLIFLSSPPSFSSLSLSLMSLSLVLSFPHDPFLSFLREEAREGEGWARDPFLKEERREEDDSDSDGDSDSDDVDEGRSRPGDVVGD
jgi:hypothetical protein